MFIKMSFQRVALRQDVKDLIVFAQDFHKARSVLPEHLRKELAQEVKDLRDNLVFFFF